MADPYSFLNGRVTLYPGDMMAVLPMLAENSIDSVVCDPPYHLTSIVKRFGGDNAAEAQSGKSGVYKRSSAGFMGKQWDGGDIAFRPETWAEVLRVMKPGAHLVAFAAPKNAHRMICAIEDAGFEIRDNLQWLFGSGFPKSHDVSKGIDKMLGARGNDSTQFNVVGNGKRSNGGDRFRSDHPEYVRPIGITEEARKWTGWGTALKPAYEPIVLARKPLSESSIAANVLKWGAGALNIGACRVSADEPAPGFGRDNRGDSSSCTCPSPTDGQTGRIPGNGSLASSASLRQPQSGHSPNGEPSGRGDQQFQGSPDDYRPSGGSCDERTRRNEALGLEPPAQLGGAHKSPAPDGGLQCNRASSKPCPIHTAPHIERQGNLGRWPANILHDGSEEVVGAFPDADGAVSNGKRTGNGYGEGFGAMAQAPSYADNGTAARFFASFPERAEEWKNSRCANGVQWPNAHETEAGLSPSEQVANSSIASPGGGPEMDCLAGAAQSRSSPSTTLPAGPETSARRIFYSSKADAEDRAGSRHPTVKPLDLIQYLCRLITPPGGTILDCFAGTGTTGEAAFREGFRAILIEREAEYQADIARRMEWALLGPDSRARAQTKLDTERGKITAEPMPLFGEAS